MSWFIFYTNVRCFKKRRRNLVVNGIKRDVKKYELRNRIEHLETTPDNYNYVGGNGVVWRTRHWSDR